MNCVLVDVGGCFPETGAVARPGMIMVCMSEVFPASSLYSQP